MKSRCWQARWIPNNSHCDTARLQLCFWSVSHHTFRMIDRFLRSEWPSKVSEFLKQSTVMVRLNLHSIITMNSPNRESFPDLPSPTQRSSLIFKFNEFLPPLFPPWRNDFSLFSLFSLHHHRVFGHFVSLTLIYSRLSFDLEGRTGNLPFFSKCAIRFPRSKIRNVFSNRNLEFWGNQH
jgi:hypothetical protein